MLEVLTYDPLGEPRPAPLLFVHGAWHGAWCFADHVLPWFAERGYAAHALSLRHHAGSGGPGSLRFSRIDDYVADIAEVADGLGEDPILVGHSMGGFVVQRYLTTGHPARAGALLAAVPPHGVLRTTLAFAAAHPLRFLWANLTWSLYPLVATPALVREAFFSEDASDETVAACHRRLCDESYRAFLDMLLLVRPDPEQATVPVRVLGASADEVIPRIDLEATARRWGTEARVFDGMAHDMILEPGWEDVCRDLHAWFESLPVAQAGRSTLDVE